MIDMIQMINLTLTESEAKYISTLLHRDADSAVSDAHYTAIASIRNVVDSAIKSAIDDVYNRDAVMNAARAMSVDENAAIHVNRNRDGQFSTSDWASDAVTVATFYNGERIDR